MVVGFMGFWLFSVVVCSSSFCMLSFILLSLMMALIGVGFDVYSLCICVLVSIILLYLCWLVDSPVQWVMVMLLGVGVFGALLSDSWFKFFIFYEGVVLPLFYLVVVGGGYYERVLSVYYLFIYTLIMTTPMFVFILYCVNVGCDMGIVGKDLSCIGGMFVGGLLLSMVVKVPVWGLHGWLPKVHVEAPTLGSILLAGILIKLGVWGVYLMALGGVGGWEWVMLWACMGSTVGITVCFMVCDVKSLIAYSSIVHMGLCLGVIVSGFYGGLLGVFLVLLVHGVVSSGLFYLGGSWGGFYGSRSVIIVSGGLFMASGIGVLIFVLWSLNMGFPISGGFVGEVWCLWLLWGFGSFWFVFILVYVFGCCMFNMYVVLLFGSGSIGGVVSSPVESVLCGVVVFWSFLCLLCLSVFI
nr:NADH dehydrogenase subunit 4 [Pseudoacanthocephalus sp.]